MKIDKLNPISLKNRIEVSMGQKKADVVLKNAKYVNVFTEKIECSDIAIFDGHIVGIGKYDGVKEIDCSEKIISPALLDGHIHLESSMVSPRILRDLIVPHGSCGLVVDPHEIANVAGLDGINYILEMTKDLDIDIAVMIPSCVPSTPLDECGADLKAVDIKKLYDNDRIFGLAEMMNAYGIVNCDMECLTKCCDCINEGKIVDGHAPDVHGNTLNAYLTANISTDHECSFFEEAVEKISKGQIVEVREGTVCKDLESLIKICDNPYYMRANFVTDDSHPDTIIKYGHIDKIIRKAIKLGADPIKAIKMGSFNTANYYGFKNMGAIGIGYIANLIILDDLETFKIDKVLLRGELAFENGNLIKKYSNTDNVLDKNSYKKVYNSFNLKNVSESDFQIKNTGSKLRCIKLIKGGVLTEQVEFDIVEKNNFPYGVDIDRDIVKIAVVERHKNTGHIGIGFINGYGIKKGAIASSIGHDSHNIIVVGVNDSDMALAVNTVKNNNGGIAIISDNEILGSLQLEVAGLMTEKGEMYVIETLDDLKNIAYEKLNVNKQFDPFMTLAFMQLPVIPDFKIIPKGLVDVKSQKVVDTVF